MPWLLLQLVVGVCDEDGAADDGADADAHDVDVCTCDGVDL